jgi:hypothetical protein
VFASCARTRVFRCHLFLRGTPSCLERARYLEQPTACLALGSSAVASACGPRLRPPPWPKHPPGTCCQRARDSPPPPWRGRAYPEVGRGPLAMHYLPRSCSNPPRPRVITGMLLHVGRSRMQCTWARLQLGRGLASGPQPAHRAASSLLRTKPRSPPLLRELPAAVPRREARPAAPTRRHPPPTKQLISCARISFPGCAWSASRRQVGGRPTQVGQPPSTAGVTALPQHMCTPGQRVTFPCPLTLA